MRSDDLKNAIAHDMDTLRHVDVDVMDRAIYYGEIRHIALRLFMFLWLPTLLAGLIWLPLQWDIFMKCPLYHLGIIVIGSMLVTVVFLSGLFGLISHFVIFKHQLMLQLITGEYLYESIMQIWKTPYLIYAGSILCITPLFGWWSACLVQFGASLLMGQVVRMCIDLEINRLGISALFCVIKKYFAQPSEPTMSTN